MKKQPSPIFITLPSLYVLLTLILTYPLIRNLNTAVPSDIGDPLLNTWIMAWNAHALLTDPLNLFDANIFHPLPNTLAYSEHLISTAIFMLPFQMAFAEPVLTYNVALLLTFPLSAFGMYLLTLRWVGRRDAAFLAGLIFAFAPYRFAAIAHLQLLTFHWLPFALLYLDKILVPYPSPLPAGEELRVRGHFHRKPIHLFGFTTFLLLQILSSWYLAVYTLLIVALYCLTHLLFRNLSLKQIYPLTLPFLLTLLVSLPFAWPYLSLLAELRAARPLSLALSLAATPLDYVAAAPFNTIFGPLTSSLRDRPNFTEENSLFIGFISPLLLLVAFINLKKLRNTQYAIAISLFITLLLSLTLTFPIPYQTLATLFPQSTIIRVPPRWMIPALFALAILAAFGYKHLQKRLYSQLTILLFTILLLLESLSLPLPLAPVENRATLNPAYAWLAQQPGQIALLELPLHSAPAPEFPEVKRLYASTSGWWRLLNGYSGYTPPRQPELAQTMAAFPDEPTVTALAELAATVPEPLYLLIHPGEAPFDRSRWETNGRWQAERNPTLQPLGEFAGDYLYQITGPAIQPITPLALFGVDQSIQLLQANLDLNPSPPMPPRLILTWQTLRPQPQEATVFIHLRAADGFVRSQADGPPVSNHYPISQWQPDELIQDIHLLPLDDYGQIDHIAIGLYHSATGERVPAFNPAGEELPDKSFMFQFGRRK